MLTPRCKECVTFEKLVVYTYTNSYTYGYSYTYTTPMPTSLGGADPDHGLWLVA